MQNSSEKRDVAVGQQVDWRAKSGSNSALRAGLAYFASVFGIGFLMGMIRVPFLVPAVGELTAVLVELPIILGLAWVICRRLVRSFEVPRTVTARFTMGGLALLLLLGAELALSTLVFGYSILDHFRSYLLLPQALGLAGQLGFGLFPLVEAGVSQRAAVKDQIQRPTTHG